MNNSEALLFAADQIRTAVISADETNIRVALSFALGALISSATISNSLKQSAIDAFLQLNTLSGTVLTQTAEAVYPELRKAAN